MASTTTGTSDERVRRTGALRRLLNRPELGSAAGAVLVFVFFAVVAGDSGFLTLPGTINYLAVAAELAVVAVPVALLMIAGEFDLSIGSMIGAAGVVLAVPIVEYGWPVWASLLLTFGFALIVGFLNGYLVVKTGLPSFIVTLAALFVLRGLTIGLTRLATGGTQVSGLDTTGAIDTFVVPLFAGSIGGFPATIFWAVGLAALATWVLLRTAFGNWIFGTGGNPVASRNMGVPVNRVKILLFMATAAGAALVAALTVLQTGSADVLRGQLREFEAIIAVVVGGVLLTGGYGSAVGPLFGALIFGMVNQGIFYTGVNSDYFQLFLGAMLLIAVLVNRYIRKKASEGS